MAAANDRAVRHQLPTNWGVVVRKGQRARADGTCEEATLPLRDDWVRWLGTPGHDTTNQTKQNNGAPANGYAPCAALVTMRGDRTLHRL